MTESQDERLGLPSASNWRRYELCAGSYQLEAEARKLGQEAHVRSVDATRGELIHAYLAGAVDEDGNEIKLSESEQITADFLQQRASGEAVRVFGDAPVQQLVEKRLWLIVKGRKLASGRFDRVLWNEAMGVAVCQDFKTGWAPPEGSEDGELNAQMRVLAVLCGLHLPSTIKEIITQLITGPFGIFERRFTIKDLAETYGDILKTLKSINAEDPPLTPGVTQCAYCPGANICPAIRKLSMPLSKFSITQLPDDPERASRLLDEITVLEDAFGQIKAFYFNRLLNDPAAKITGYELVPNAPRREIEDVQAAKLRLSEYLDEGELNAALDLKVGQVEKLFGKKLGLKGKELREKFNAVMQNVITEKMPNPSLKRIGGKPKFTETMLEQQMALSDKTGE